MFMHAEDCQHADMKGRVSGHCVPLVGTESHYERLRFVANKYRVKA